MNRYRRTVFAALIILAVFTLPLAGQSTGGPMETMDLFSDALSPPVSLDSERGWTPIAAFDWNSRPSSFPSGEPVKWRLMSSYEHGRSSGPVTLQIRLRGADGTPIFTHPWSEGADRSAEAYSNWFEDRESSIGLSGTGLVEARFIAPPRTPVSGTLYSVSLEAWPTVPADAPVSPVESVPRVALAYARPLPTDRPSPIAPADVDAVDPRLGIAAALDFSLEFVESCITGNLPAYYRSQAETVRSLDDGSAMVRYRLTPPAGIPGVSSLDDYRKRFDYTIRPVSELSELFPEWFDKNRPWIPGENAYLFMGNRDRYSGAFPENVDYLVFLVEPDDEGSWEVIARPGR